ncbi:hypothetical protein B0H16DRAFT_1564116, partial [Mycena metata]
ATSTFTPYAERDRERERERGGRGRSIYGAGSGGAPARSASYVNVRVNVNVGYGGTGTAAFTAVRARSTPAQQSYEYVPPPLNTVVQYPLQYAAQIAPLSASSNTAAARKDDAPPDASLVFVALRPCVPALAPPAFTFNDEPRVAVRTAARGDAAAAAFVRCFLCFLFDGGHGDLGRCRWWVRGIRVSAPHTLTALWDYVNAGHGGVVQQPQVHSRFVMDTDSVLFSGPLDTSTPLHRRLSRQCLRGTRLRTRNRTRAERTR